MPKLSGDFILPSRKRQLQCREKKAKLKRQSAEVETPLHLLPFAFLPLPF
jgi:hypothetical protein